MIYHNTSTNKGECTNYFHQELSDIKISKTFELMSKVRNNDN